MHLPEIWDTDLFPLAPVTRPRDIPVDHSIDVWVRVFVLLECRATMTGRTMRLLDPQLLLKRMVKRPIPTIQVSTEKIPESCVIWIPVF